MGQGYQMMDSHWSQSCVSSAVLEEWDGEEENADRVQVGQGLQKKRTGQSSGGGEDSGGGDDGIWGRRLKMDQGRRSLS